MIDPNLKSIALVKKETGETISNIRLILDVMNGSVDDAIEIVKRFHMQGQADFRKTLAENYSLGAPLTLERIDEAEKKLGYILPSSYKKMLLNQNGVILENDCIRVTEDTSWAEGHVCVQSILGIGEYNGLGLEEQNTKEYCESWGYPNIGLVICDTPTAGHTVVMLDYTSKDDAGEPSVVFVDLKRRQHEFKVVKLADNFNAFMENLVSSEELDCA